MLIPLGILEKISCFNTDLLQSLQESSYLKIEADTSDIEEVMNFFSSTFHECWKKEVQDVSLEFCDGRDISEFNEECLKYYLYKDLLLVKNLQFDIFDENGAISYDGNALVQTIHVLNEKYHDLHYEGYIFEEYSGLNGDFFMEYEISDRGTLLESVTDQYHPSILFFMHRMLSFLKNDLPGDIAEEVFPLVIFGENGKKKFDDSFNVDHGYDVYEEYEMFMKLYAKDLADWAVALINV